MAVISGHGATIGFGVETGWTPQYTSIGGFDATRESLDTSHLGTTGTRTKIGGDLYEISPFTASFFIQPDQLATTDDNSFDDILFTSGAVHESENVTITYPDAGAATCAGSAHVVGISIGELVTNQIFSAEITVQYDDWPTFAE